MGVYETGPSKVHREVRPRLISSQSAHSLRRELLLRLGVDGGIIHVAVPRAYSDKIVSSKRAQRVLPLGTIYHSI